MQHWWKVSGVTIDIFHVREVFGPKTLLLLFLALFLKLEELIAGVELKNDCATKSAR